MKALHDLKEVFLAEVEARCRMEWTLQRHMEVCDEKEREEHQCDQQQSMSVVEEPPAPGKPLNCLQYCQSNLCVMEILLRSMQNDASIKNVSVEDPLSLSVQATEVLGRIREGLARAVAALSS
jgi:hypothetical protein